MTKSMTYLEAFCSEDAKRGREWITADGTRNRRVGITLEYLLHPDKDDWRIERGQVAAMEGTVTWADDPKTLTPQEVLRALADGKEPCCEEGGKVRRIKLDASGFVMEMVEGAGFWSLGAVGDLNDYSLPDPSQPAEPRRDWNPCGKYEDMPQDIQEDIKTERGWAKHEPVKPPLKVGDRVKRRGHEHKGVGCVIKVRPNARDGFIEIQWDEGVGSYPNDSGFVLVEAEPQAEYPLSYADALVALHDKEMIARHDIPHERGRLMDGELQWGSPGKWLSMRTLNFQDAKQASWRIVEPTTGGGKP